MGLNWVVKSIHFWNQCNKGLINFLQHSITIDEVWDGICNIISNDRPLFYEKTYTRSIRSWCLGWIHWKTASLTSWTAIGKITKLFSAEVIMILWGHINSNRLPLISSLWFESVGKIKSKFLYNEGFDIQPNSWFILNSEYRTFPLFTTYYINKKI